MTEKAGNNAYCRLDEDRKSLECSTPSPPPGWEPTLWRTLISLGLLLAGWLILRLGSTSWAGGVIAGGETVSGICAFSAAIIAAAPLFRNALAALFSQGIKNIVDQMAGLAVLAAFVQGDFTTAVIVSLALDLGHMAEERGIRTAGAAIESLVRLSARTAHRLDESGENDLPADKLEVGDRVAVYPGEVIPADGDVSAGFSAINPAHLTGESTPVDVGPGDAVFHGTINLSGRIEVTVRKVSSETNLGRVIAALEKAEDSRPPVVRMLEKYAGFLLPVVILTAAATFVLSREPSRAIAVLIVACPCALVLSSPAAMIPALAIAVRKGILIKGGAFLERAGKIKTLILDKTGTLTLGELSVDKFIPAESVDPHELEMAARTAATGSRHPVSLAVVRSGAPVHVEATREEPGKGVEVERKGSIYRIGRLGWVSDLSYPDNGRDKKYVQDHPGPVSWVSRDKKLLGAVLLTDSPRPGIRAALDEIKSLGVERRVLLTGDKMEVSRSLADRFGFDRVEAESLPETKDKIVYEEMNLISDQNDRESRDGKSAVLFVGDGVNDALALSKADVGVAMGAMGSEIALHSADIALMTNDLMLLPFLVKLSRRVTATIRTNVIVGVGFSVLMLLLAVFGIITPIWGAILHHGGTLFVIGNSLRILGDEKFQPLPQADPA